MSYAGAFKRLRELSFRSREVLFSYNLIIYLFGGEIDLSTVLGGRYGERTGLRSVIYTAYSDTYF